MPGWQNAPNPPKQLLSLLKFRLVNMKSIDQQDAI